MFKITIIESIEIHQMFFYNILKETTSFKDCFYISIGYHILIFILFTGIISDIIRFSL